MEVGTEGEDLDFAQSVIVDLQHLLRGLRDELANERVANALLARQLEEVRSAVLAGEAEPLGFTTGFFTTHEKREQ